MAENTYIEVFSGGEINTTDRAPIAPFCLETDDIDQVAQRLTENGYPVTGGTCRTPRGARLKPGTTRGSASASLLIHLAVFIPNR